MPAFYKEAQSRLQHQGAIKSVVRDIEGCYPAMPKEAIRLALREVAARIKREQGYTGVWVPRRATTKPCQWKYRGSKTSVQWLSFEVMLDVMGFALDNAFVQMPDGQILRQTLGIPMGDPLSPGMTIGTCGWMEDLWMAALADKHKQYFMAKRYMDDILLFYVERADWDHARFLADFEESQCYWPPLRLEQGHEAQFLESQFFIEENVIRFRLKNANESGKAVWRYHHYESYSQFQQKRATLMACLRKVSKVASDNEQLWISAVAKLDEFRQLGYPRSLRTYACAIQGRDTRNTTWFRVRAHQK